jgi:hypothetical protein
MTELLKTFGNLSDDAQFIILIMFCVCVWMITKIVRVLKGE